MVPAFWNYPEDWFGWGQPQPAGGEPPNHRTSAGPGSDEQLADQAVAALRRDPEVYARQLEIMVQNRVVILFGDVDSAHIRTAVGRCVWAVPGVFDVVNCLTVRGAALGLEDFPR